MVLVAAVNNVMRENHWFIASFSPSCSESRFIGEGRHVYSTRINKYSKAPEGRHVYPKGGT